MEIGTKISNFTVTAVRPVPDKDALMVQMVYEQTGTELVWIKSKEANKLFCIGFKTIPEDDTGVFHILEHSVLCGSDKYPVKEPFVELLKSSMNTFLNAMTFPDKTIYPVSSRNAQDFLNLTGVYLDAVFAPAILREPNIYRQEGWHYELDGETLTYNGVVFNEMKGAMSSVDEIAERGIMHLLFPDNCYRFNSGGEPAAIPNLTYEQFIDSYKRNYHPTNARIFLDGDIPVEETFALLDSYLSRYAMGEKQHLDKQIPVSHTETAYYEAPNDGTPQAQFVMGKILGDFSDKTGLLARQVLCDVLAGSNDAPLKKAVLDTGLCRDMSLDISDGMIQPYMVLRLRNMEAENAEKLEQVIRSCARSLLEQGIPKERLTASINNLSFQVRKLREPQALLRCINSLSSWLYDGDPMLYLHYGDSIALLRQMAQEGAFEALLEEMLLQEDGLCRLHVLPSETYGAKLRDDEAARLAAAKAAMSAEELQQVADTFAAFTRWQQTPDTAEGLATLPRLELSQIGREPVVYETVEDTACGVTLLRHKADCNGIVYLRAYFRLTDVTLEELTRLSVLTGLLGRLPTAHYTADELNNQIKTWLGDLTFGLSISAHRGCRTACTPMLTVGCSVLQENLAKAEELIFEILTTTDLHQPERIRQMLQQSEIERQQRSMMGGHVLAYQSVLAHYSSSAAAREAIGGHTALQYLHKLNKEFDELFPALVALGKGTLSAALCRSRMTLSLTEDGASHIAGFAARFPEGAEAPATVTFQTALPRKLGIRIPAQVSYASLGFHLGEAGLAFDGTALVLSNILSLAHLWNEVRVQGGAYGAGARIGQNGNLFTYSYRDPNPARSLEVYRNMASFVEAFAAAESDLTGFIISTVADTEPLVGPGQQGALADDEWFAGWTYDDAVALRRQILETDGERLRAWCAALEALRTEAAVCVVGFADALDTCKDEDLTIVDL